MRYGGNNIQNSVKAAFILYILFYSFYFTLQKCIFNISGWFSIQYVTYYIPLESSNFALFNGMVVKVKFPHIWPLYIFYLLSFLFECFIYLKLVLFKYCNMAGNVSYLITYVMLSSKNIQESCSATHGLLLYSPRFTLTYC